MILAASNGMRVDVTSVSILLITFSVFISRVYYVYGYLYHVINIDHLRSSLRWSLPVGKIAEKAVYRSVFLTIWHCIFECRINCIFECRINKNALLHPLG